jgi:cell division septation protein DedD
MYKVHTPEEVNKLKHLQHKKNLLVRFMMKGCPGCIYSQDDWDNACKRAVLSPDDAMLELESNFVEHFQEMMRMRNTNVEIDKFPTILFIRGRRVTELPGRDTDSILNMLKNAKRSPTPTPTRTPKRSPKQTRTPKRSPKQTRTPKRSPTPTPTRTPKRSPKPTPTELI